MKTVSEKRTGPPEPGETQSDIWEPGEPIRYDDLETGRVHTHEQGALRVLVKSLGLTTAEELTQWTGFRDNVIEDLLEGHRPVPVSVWRDILRGVQGIRTAEPARYYGIIEVVQNLLMGNTGLELCRPDTVAVAETAAPAVAVQELDDIPLSRRELYEHCVDWEGVVSALRSNRAVTIRVPETGIDIVLRLVEENLTKAGEAEPCYTYNAHYERLWLWGGLTELWRSRSPNGGDRGGTVVDIDAEDAEDAEQLTGKPTPNPEHKRADRHTNESKPASPAPPPPPPPANETTTTGRPLPDADASDGDGDYIEYRVGEFRLATADRVPFCPSAWSVANNRFCNMDWESVTFAMKRGLAAALACNPEERGALEAVAAYQIASPICTHYDEGLLWISRLEREGKTTCTA